uniref:AlNc14C119G6620 protein n=1 Tax=Albugo laibachii Nc14 TaxID=890382 RepID=F0WJ88_9STRA|nr:AlNc14C119G6620 [Albugo laibachii Nc14]|eukprot:CCA21335.1 AlNc14C119G6620 [Albugo laibachii Nc14]
MWCDDGQTYLEQDYLFLQERLDYTDYGQSAMLDTFDERRGFRKKFVILMYEFFTPEKNLEETLLIFPSIACLVLDERVGASPVTSLCRSRVGP